MKTGLKIGGLVLLVMGLGLCLSMCAPSRSPTLSNVKGAFADVASSGAYGEAGLVLLMIGSLCWAVQTFIKQ